MKNKKGINTVLTAGIIAGTADALAAIFIYSKPVNLHNAAAIFRYIASGLLGAKAFQPGVFYPVAGLALHFLIALCWAAIYFYVVGRIFSSRGLFLKILVFASLIWIVMNGFVRPMAGFKPKYDQWAIMHSWFILVLCVSLPIVALTDKNRPLKT